MQRDVPAEGSGDDGKARAMAGSTRHRGSLFVGMGSLWRGGDRELAPAEYDDWIDELVTVLLSDSTAESVQRFLRTRVAEEGVNPAFVAEFDADGLVHEISLPGQAGGDR
jgi:hypothetical protein